MNSDKARQPHKIVHVAKMTSVDGMERHLLTLLPALKARGLNVHLWILVEADKPLDAYAEEMRGLGVPAEQIIIKRDFDPVLIWKLIRKIRRGAFDAVHTHLIHADLHAVLAARLARVRHIFFSAHNNDSFRRRLPVRLVQAWLWRKVESGIAISEALRQFVISVEFAPPNKAYTVHYGLDPMTIKPATHAREALCRELGLEPGAVIIGSLCRLTRQKGIRYAIQAFREVITLHPNAHLVIWGDGPLRETLKQEVQTAGLEAHIHFLGWRSDAHSLLAAYDVLLMPSLWEGFGLVALEPMALARPIAASRFTALPEIVEHGETGYLVPPADPGALAQCLNGLIADPERRRQLGDNGRRRLESTFSVDKMVEGTLKAYRLL